MDCDAFENTILELLDNQLPTDQRHETEKHIAGCVRCQSFFQQARQMEANLAQTIKCPALPSDFRSKLQQRIQTEPNVLPNSERARRKAQLQAEFERELVQLRRTSLSLPHILRIPHFTVLFVLIILAVLKFTPLWRHSIGEINMLTANPDQFLCYVLSAVSLLLGFSWAFPRRRRGLHI